MATEKSSTHLLGVPKDVLRIMARLLAVLGWDPMMMRRSMGGILPMLLDYVRLRRQNNALGHRYNLFFNYPCPGDRHCESGTVKGHYFQQDLLVAQKIFASKIEKHVDVGSRVDGFVAHVASFSQIEVFDIRPMSACIPNINFRQVDLMNIPSRYMDYCDSLSCLHAMEHFGLGRYGDPIDIEGHAKGFVNLAKLLRPGGTLYLSVPIGRERIEFNGHRVFDIQTILKLSSEQFDLSDFAYIDDRSDLHIVSPQSTCAEKDNFGCVYGCGIFELKKRS